MGKAKEIVPRVVFDTSVLVSAMVFPQGELSWLRSHWSSRECTPLISTATADQLTDVLGYRKFNLSLHDQQSLLEEYLPISIVVSNVKSCPVICRDRTDQIFLDLAHSGAAHVLVSSDKDLLVLAGKTKFQIESPQRYRLRVLKGDERPHP